MEEIFWAFYYSLKLEPENTPNGKAKQYGS